jgi:hypothetical protein
MWFASSLCSSFYENSNLAYLTDIRLQRSSGAHRQNDSPHWFALFALFCVWHGFSPAPRLPLCRVAMRLLHWSIDSSGSLWRMIFCFMPVGNSLIQFDYKWQNKKRQLKDVHVSVIILSLYAVIRSTFGSTIKIQNEMVFMSHIYCKGRNFFGDKISQLT